MFKRVPLVLVLLVLSAAAARALDPEGSDMVPLRTRIAAATKETPKDESQPLPLRWMLQPLKRGIFVRLPIVDTDPNRGITYGVMPIAVLQGKHDDRIEQIHAPSLTYNKQFGVNPTYRYYYYPREDASFVGRVSRAKFEHEVMAQYEDRGIMNTPYDVFGRFQQTLDAGQRFFGFGPDSGRTNEANYTQNYWLFKTGVGTPLWKDSPWRAHFSDRYEASKVDNGPIRNLADFSALYPGQVARHTEQTNESRINIDYDTRDHAVTTGRGVYGNVFAEAAVRGYLSQYDYTRYGLDGRWFHPSDAHPDRVFAIQGIYEQLLGPTPPFWLLPSLGGKYSLRSYGDGRYTDRGMAAINAEERFKLFEARTAGVTTELQLAPFVGVGQVFDTPGRAALKYTRPVMGAAIRAVAKPQVVGSVDIGVGREGVAVFTDINYSF